MLRNIIKGHVNMNKGIIFGSSTYTGPRVCGAYRIATHIRQLGWDVEVVDFISFWTLSELKELTRTRVDHNTKFIGVGLVFIDTVLPVLESYFIWVRSTYPHIKIIAGHGTMTASFINKHIHYHIRGFGEHAVSALLHYLFSNGPAPKFCFPYTNVIDSNTFYPAFPMPELYVGYEARDFIGENEWLTVETGRGCIFSCAYCSFPVIGVRGDYSRSASDFKQQLQTTYDIYGVSNYAIADETFNDRPDKISKFADVVESLEFKPRFTAYIRPDLLIRRPQDREQLLRMNVLAHFYGIETMNTPTGKAVGKGMPSEELKAGLLDVRRYFETHGEYYRTTMSVIYGLPYETLDTISDAEQWFINNWQQQCVLVYPLRINKSTAGVESKISANLAKYGYTEIPEDRVDNMALEYAERYPKYADEFLSPDFTESDHSRGVFDENHDLVMWENPNINICDAAVRAAQWKTTVRSHDFRLGAFELGYLSNDDIKTRLDRRQIHSRDNILTVIHGTDLINKYKRQKLDYK